MCVISQPVTSVLETSKCPLKKKVVGCVKSQRSTKSNGERLRLLQQLRSVIVTEMPSNLTEKMEVEKSVASEVDIVLATARLIQQLEAKVLSLPSPPPFLLQMLAGKQGQASFPFLNLPITGKKGSVQRQI